MTTSTDTEDINKLFNPKKSDKPLEEKFQICRSVGEECQMDEELRKLLEVKDHPICYDGFEPSGRMHIAQGILKAINVNKLTSCGCIFKFWVADWFALLNNKMDGDLNKIRKVGEYFIEVWKAVGMDMSNVQFVWASDEINGNSDTYWRTVMDISRKNTVSRIKRCGQIMGREDGEEIPAAQIMYPCMQCADIFHLKADICQLGMDQRKVNMLAREYCDSIKKKFKPVILSHGMLPGLLEGQTKMSKSDPDSAIFMEDSAKEVNRKITKAYCPPERSDPQRNPCINYCQSLVFPKFGKLEITRKEEYGGDITFETIQELKEAYRGGSLHPGDLKTGLAKALNQMIQPVRDHFENDPKAKALIQQVKSFKVTK